MHLCTQWLKASQKATAPKEQEEGHPQAVSLPASTGAYCSAIPLLSLPSLPPRCIQKQEQAFHRPSACTGISPHINFLRRGNEKNGVRNSSSHSVITAHPNFKSSGKNAIPILPIPEPVFGRRGWLSNLFDTQTRFWRRGRLFIGVFAYSAPISLPILDIIPQGGRGFILRCQGLPPRAPLLGSRQCFALISP